MTQNLATTESDLKQHRGPFLLIGSIMWVICLVAICYGWYVWRERVLVAKSESDSSVEKVRQMLREGQPDDDDGRVQKQIRLVPQKDGTLVAQEVTEEDRANLWDAEGIEDFSFTNTDGRTLGKNDLLGKPFIISFVFTLCRGPCPNVTLQMRELQDQLKDYDFNLITLTVDPERDTMETLEGYGRENGANFDRWKFLTGNQAEIYGLIHRSFKMPVKEETGKDRVPGFEIIHSTNIMLVDATGRVIGKYNAQKEDAMGKLRKDLKRIAKPKVSEIDG